MHLKPFLTKFLLDLCSFVRGVIFLFSLVYQLTHWKGLIQKGPYKYVRHPQYLGIIIMTFGLTIICFNTSPVFPFSLDLNSALMWVVSIWIIEALTYLLLAGIEDLYLKSKYKENYLDLIMAALLVGMFISMPIWGKIADITNNDRKTIIIEATFLTIVTIPLFFIGDYTIMLIAIFIWGMGEGGYWVMMSPVIATIIDESVIMTGRRKEGIYQGFQTFVSNGGFSYSSS